MKLRYKIKSHLVLLLLYILLAVFFRFFSFFPSELDHDESTYMIIGNELLKGKELYSDVTDTKPVGIFLIYAALQAIFGYSIFLKRLFVAFIVGITCYLVQRCSLKLFRNEPAALASGIIYLFYTSTWCYFGLSTNTELFFNFFTILSLLFFIRRSNLSFMAGALMMGVGFMIKYLVLFDYASFMLVFFIWDIKANGTSLKLTLLYPYILSVIGFLIPFALTAVYFKLENRFDDFYFITFELPQLYKVSPSIIRYFKMLGDLLLRFFPISFFFFYVVLKTQFLKEKKLQLLFLLWMVFVLIAMYLPAKEFSHYTIQLMLPVSLVAGLYFHSHFEPKGFMKIVSRGKTGIVTLLMVVLLIQVSAYFDNVAKPDHYKQVASYLKENLNEDETVFVSNYEPVIYYLLKQDSPTKYVHSSLLFTDLYKAFRFDNINEIERIMNQNHKFVLIQYENEIVEEMMGDKYELNCTFRNSEVLVYKMK